MPRQHDNWLTSYINYTAFTEAPAHIHWWVGVSTIAGALGRKAWIDQYSFKWFPNHYIFIVGPPDIISKGTTMGLGMRLLKRLPDFIMGPTSCTWPALIKEMSEVHEVDFDLGDGTITKLCSCTVASSELGNFIKTKDGEFLDVMISLWDGDTIDKKLIKEGGSVYVENPLLNLIGCTTPSWMAENIPEHMLEGGLLSRVIMVYGEAVDHPVAYPGDVTPVDIKEQEASLLSDLVEISKIKGEFTMTKEAKAWGKQWYDKMKTATHTGDEKVRDGITRKQTHVHKLAIVLSAARSGDRIIQRVDLEQAVQKINELAAYRSVVVKSIGKTLESTLADRLIDFVQKKKACNLQEAYSQVHAQIPNSSAFMDLVSGLVKSGYVKEQNLGGVITLVSLKGRI